ncbi:hypothetical protein BCR36DRAFT_444432 [Piromyces finnis]|uniref:L domain-like protein n=1 Tax=Piromyces finnis TaxID=1754191 RepID=A0A1Y1VCB4_9FUNG|nr:hypothetical protein BCR36DRAFT_444432 [Piromyces finnis]|eukprot:ORX52526.1 hypothetical protein BCR36DRAFT_444432 [Piromyces finnis]
MIILKVKISLSYVFLSLYIIGNYILKVKGQISDCAIFKEVVNELGSSKRLFESDDCCNLIGAVTCENNHITKIKMNDLKCNGIPEINIEKVVSKLSKLQYLASLEMSHGSSCPFPLNIQELKNLKSLTLTGNNYRKDIPENVSLLAELERLDLSSNNLRGTIPDSFRNLKKNKTFKFK